MHVLTDDVNCRVISGQEDTCHVLESGIASNRSLNKKEIKSRFVLNFVDPKKKQPKQNKKKLLSK